MGGALPSYHPYGELRPEQWAVRGDVGAMCACTCARAVLTYLLTPVCVLYLLRAVGAAQ